MTMLFTVLGLVVSFAAGAPIMSMVLSKWNMIVINGAPGNQGDFKPKTTKLKLTPKGTVNQSEVKVPRQGESYGNISCERIALAAPIYYGDSDECFEKGVGQYTGSGLPGQGKPILIGGHDGSFFAPLEDILVDDIIVISTNYGSFQYKVTELKTVEKVDSTVYDLTQQKEQLILYTCYPFGQVIGDRSGRYFVYCDRISDTENITQ
jgi:sortase A